MCVRYTALCMHNPATVPGPMASQLSVATSCAVCKEEYSSIAWPSWVHMPPQLPALGRTIPSTCRFAYWLRCGTRARCSSGSSHIIATRSTIIMLRSRRCWSMSSSSSKISGLTLTAAMSMLLRGVKPWTVSTGGSFGFSQAGTCAFTLNSTILWLSLLSGGCTSARHRVVGPLFGEPGMTMELGPASPGPMPAPLFSSSGPRPCRAFLRLTGGDLSLLGPSGPHG
mmetsp:Transcript_8800/g.25343  ORF Transcript_8800/g.25343 Transcript_8800/m.25343 type:complete len:226 (-) Transcript_8800:2497-3174(-)